MAQSERDSSSIEAQASQGHGRANALGEGFVDFLIDKLGNQLTNSLLELDPETLSRLAPFRGKVFAIALTAPKLLLHLHPSAAGFEISRIDDAQIDDTNQAESTDAPAADVTLTGSLLAFIALARSDISKEAFHSGRVRIEGDAELGAAFQAVLAGLDLDWEELASRFVGDGLARQGSVALSLIQSRLNRHALQSRNNLAEVIQEELRLSPSAVEVENFTREVESLRSALARVEARINALAQQR